MLPHINAILNSSKGMGSIGSTRNLFQNAAKDKKVESRTDNFDDFNF